MIIGVNDMDKVIDITANADVFIIPNPARMEDEIYMIERLKEFAAYNGCGMVVPAVEVWIVSDDLGSANVADHGISIITTVRNNSELIKLPCSVTVDMCWMPAAMLRPYKECDTFEAKYKFRDVDIDGVLYTINLNLLCTAAQRNYRYSNFGTFEEVLQMVTRGKWPDQWPNQ